MPVSLLMNVCGETDEEHIIREPGDAARRGEGRQAHASSPGRGPGALSQVPGITLPGSAAPRTLLWRLPEEAPCLFLGRGGTRRQGTVPQKMQFKSALASQAGLLSQTWFSHWQRGLCHP